MMLLFEYRIGVSETDKCMPSTLECNGACVPIIYICKGDIVCEGLQMDVCGMLNINLYII